MSSEYIIKYLSDISDVVQGASRVDQVNKQMANTLTGEYSKAVRTIGNTISKITDKKIKVKVEVDGEKTTKEVDQRVQALTQTVETADGKFHNFTQTITKHDGEFYKMKGSLKEVTGKYKVLETETEKSKKSLKSVAGASSQLSTNFKNLKDINQKYASSLGEVGKASRVVGKSFYETTDNVTKVGHVVQTANGQFIQLKETITKTADGGQTVNRSMKDVSSQFSKTNVETEKSKKNFLGMAENMKRLASRALMTIPVWMALRGTMQAVSKTMRDGATALVDQDRALQKARRNLQGSAEDIEKNFNTLKKSAQEFSLKTGESMVNVITAFQRFATTGLDFETSMAGALASTKTAILLFGETEEIANAVARSFRVLGGRTDDFTSDGEELSGLLATISELWKTNAFEIDEFASAFERIAPKAKQTNLSLQETNILISALHTAGIRGTRSTRLLSTAITKMYKNYDKFGKTLGINLNTVDSTYDKLRLVTTALEELNKTDVKGAVLAVDELFGRRAGDPVIAMASLNKELDKMEGITGNLDDFNNQFEEMNKQVHNQVKVFKNLRTEIGKAFIVGVVGGDNFKDSLISINKEMLKLQTSSQAFGGFIKELLSPLGELNTFDPIFTDELLEAHPNARKLFTELLKVADVTKQISGIKGLADLFGDIGKNDVNMDNFTKETEKQIKDAVESAFNNAKPEKKAITKTEKSSIAEAVLKSELDRLKAQGMLTSQLLKSEEVMRKQLKIEEEGLSLVEKRLDKEKALREEKELQSRLGGTSMKLFDIAKEEGTSMAKKIGDVLSGEMDFSTFVKRGGEAVDIFKENFSDIFKQQQAEAFFKGLTVPGEKGLKGGAGIALPIADEGIRTAGVSMAKTASSMDRAVRIFQQSVDTFSKKTVAQPTGKALDTTPIAIDPKITEILKKQSDALASSKNLITIADLEKLTKEQKPSEMTLSKQTMSIFEAFLPKEAIGAESHAVGDNLFRMMDWDYGAKGKQFDEQLKAEQAISTQTKEINPTINAPVTVNTKLNISALDEVESKFMNEVSKQLQKVGSEIYRSLTIALTGKQNRIM